MSLRPGDKVLWFRQVHPRTPVPAVLVDTKGNRARITIQEKDGSSRTLSVSIDLVEPLRMTESAPGFAMCSPGFGK